MNKLYFATIALTAALACAPHVQASPVLPLTDNQTFTTDPISGLDWLDLTASAGLSFNYVSGQFGNGGEFEGYRYATLSDLNELIQNVTGTIISPSQQSSVDIDFAVGAELHRLFGTTRISSSNPDRVYAEGIIQLKPTLKFIANIEVDFGNKDAQYYPTWTTAKANNNQGSFLVRQTPSAVPVPAAAFMFAPAVLGFLGLRRRAKQA